MKKPGFPGFFIVFVNADLSNELFDGVLSPATTLGASAKSAALIERKSAKPQKEGVPKPTHLRRVGIRATLMKSFLVRYSGLRFGCSAAALPRKKKTL